MPDRTSTERGDGMDNSWERFCTALEHRIGAQNMEIWVRSGAIRLEHEEPGRVRLRAENRVTYEWIRDNFLTEIRAAWEETQGRVVSVDITWAGAPLEVDPPQPARSRRGASHLERTMIFENFVVGKCNEFAHSVACGVADAPGVAYNPLFIYGSTGLGKTHLMHSIGNRVERRLGGGVLYMTGQQFFDQMVSAFQNRTIPEFRERFRTEVDVLLLDDVQFIAGRDRTAEEVFYVFETMLSARKQIVLAADQPPQEIGKLEPRLRTRFSQGLLADVQPPDVETMMAILAKKADAMHLVLPSDVQYTIAQRVRNSVRDAEGVLNRLAALHAFYGRPITMSFVMERMADVLPREAPPPSADLIIERVSEHYHIRVVDMRSERRPANIARPRQLAMYLCRTVARLSFPEIARSFDRDNSTVQYACKKVAADVKRDPNLRAEVDMLEKIVRGGE
ncbi:MAG: chromosomal replication initiator protein DnaA [Myxococcales bacterium]|nr:chromosomal replication initiator protein DnaA [Myxococcales bacterium]